MSSKNEGGFEIDLKEVALLLLKRIWILLLCFAVCFGALYYIVEIPKKPMYIATATMYVSSSNETISSYSTNESRNSQDLIKVCSVVIKQNVVTEPVIEEMQVRAQVLKQNAESLAADADAIETGAAPNDTVSLETELGAADTLEATPQSKAARLRERSKALMNLYDEYMNMDSAFIAESVDVSPVDETQVMKITCTTEDAQMSIDICNSVLDIVPDMLIERIKVGVAEPLDTATEITTVGTNYPSFKIPALGGLALALVVAVVIVLSYYLDTRIKSKEEITERYGIPILSEIPNFNMKSKERYRTYYGNE